MEIIFFIIQILILAAIAPMISGIITKIKNNLRLRQGPDILQPYRNLWKLLAKEEIIPKSASCIFVITPYIVLATSITALVLGFNHIENLLMVIFVLGLGRFFLALAGLDSGSSFGGMGSSREMFIASFVEPAVMLIVYFIYLSNGIGFNLSHLLAGISLLIVLLAETSRLPIDNQETHLELTMIHEAMILDYCGPSLALLEFSSQIKQLFWFSLLIGLFMSFNLVFYILGILVLIITISFVEIGVAKYRLFKAPDLIILASILGLLAIASLLLGV